MRVVIFSDVHVVGFDDPVQAQLVRFLAGLEADQVWILGDLFHAGWDFRGRVASGIAATVEALQALCTRGVTLGFIAGNHDFGLASLLERQLGAEVREAHVRDMDGTRVLLAHGDEADTSLGYALTRGLLRSAAFDALVVALGEERGTRLLLRLAGASRDYPAPRGRLVEAQARWAEARLAELDASIAVLGHSHALGETALPHGRLFNLGDWRDGPRWLEIADGRPTLMPR